MPTIPIQDRRNNVYEEERKAIRTTSVSSDGVTESTIKENNHTGNGELLVNLEGHICEDNSTSTPLLADAVFEGEWQDTLDYNTITIGINSDVDSAEDGFCVCWSADGVTINDSDSFSILADKSKVFTFSPARRYFKTYYVNGSTDQTIFNIQAQVKRGGFKPSSHRIKDNIVADDDATLQKSVLTGEDPFGTFRNVNVQLSGALNTSIEDGQTARRAEVEPLGSLKTVESTRVVGTAFSNGTKDPNFWTETVVGSGTVTQSGEITLSTGTTANSSAKYTSIRKARKITGATNQFRAVARNVQSPSINCIRRIGAYGITDGFFLQYDGTTFGVGKRKNSIDTVIENGNFNGNLGATIEDMDTEFTRIIIDYTALSAKFFINGILIHTIIADEASNTNTLDLPVTFEIINENGNTTNNSYEVLFASILTLGKIRTQAKSAPITTNTTTILKYGAGVLQRIVNTNNAGSVIVYDNTTATGTQLVSPIDTAKALGDLNFDAPFNNGLTVITSGGAQITVIYE